MLFRSSKANNKIVIGVLHDLNLVHYFADSVILLDNGRVVASGNPKYVLNDDIIKDVYNIDIKCFMLNALDKWKNFA